MAKECAHCGATFTKAAIGPISAAKWARRRYCSKPCHQAHQRGENAPAWRGDYASPQAGRKRAHVLYPDPDPCEVCGAHAERHHIDGNPLNNARENIAFLCVRHHIEAEDRYAHLRKPREAQAERRRAWARARWANRTDEERERDRARQREYMRQYRMRDGARG